MAYGTIKVDTVTFTNDGVDKSVTLSGLVQNPTFSGNVTVTGTLSGVTVTGTTANFTSGNFTNISGGTHTITSGVFAAGSAASPSITFTGDLNTGIYSPGADQVAISTGGSGRLFVDASGRVGVGTSSPSTLLHIQSTDPAFRFKRSDAGTDAYGELTADTSGLVTMKCDPANAAAGSGFRITVDNSEALRVDSSGRVGIGTTSPSYALDVINNSTYQLRLASSTSNYASGGLYLGAAGTGDPYYYGYVQWNQGSTTLDIAAQDGTGGGGLRFLTNGGSTSPTERARIDVTGRLLVGTSSASGTNTLFESSSTTANAANVALVKRNSGTADQAGQQLHFYNFGPANTARAADTEVGSMRFYGSQPTSGAAQEMARITCAADLLQTGTNTSGRLVFSTTANGASSPTERMRILSDGNVIIGKAGQTVSYQNPGINLFSSGSADFTRASAYLISVNRKTDDGVLVEFYQDNNLEGTISVSGTTVSYNGAHLSRWSQLPSGTERTEILRGTVLSNIDEMCEWGDEENEQLNRMKVSDVEGDKNVAGVFQAWDDDDDTYTNDFYCAMTGDFIIRIGAGVTVERGDLLMSAGDGTAKPQDDDIIRSKTIAKVTSTNVSCTYDDGSYCVPCVLMAC